VSVITTYAPFALKVQRKVSNGVAGLAAARIISAMPLDDPMSARNPCRLAGTRKSRSGFYSIRSKPGHPSREIRTEVQM
jgi:hypothetical protein